MIKMFVSSFYNTLINEEDAIPTSTMFELDRIRQQKIKFVILTNRLEEDVLYYNESYPFIDYIISLNGSIILDVAKDKRIEGKPFTEKELQEIKSTYSGKEIFYYSKEKVLKEPNGEKIYKVEVTGPKKELESYLENLRYENSILEIEKECYLELTKNNPYDALNKLLKGLKISKEEVLGIIGNESERKILENMENIYLVRNASKDLKSLTDHLTKTNKSKGVEAVIKKEIK